MDFKRDQELPSHGMKMSHVYQPVMIKAILDLNARAAEDDCKRFLELDSSQIEYYEAHITKRMPGLSSPK